MVSDSYQALFYATRLNHWIDLDHSFHSNGCISFSCLAGIPGKSGSKNCSAFICCPAHSQCSMECGFLHPSIPGQWSLGYCRFMDLDSHNYCEILAHKQNGGAIARALYNLGKRCSLLELLALEIESLK